MTSRGRISRRSSSSGGVGVKILNLAPRSIDSLRMRRGFQGLRGRGARCIYCKVKTNVSGIGATNSTSGGLIMTPTTLRATGCLRGRFNAPCRIKCPFMSRLVPRLNCREGGVLVVRRRIVTGTVERRVHAEDSRRGARIAITD